MGFAGCCCYLVGLWFGSWLFFIVVVMMVGWLIGCVGFGFLNVLFFAGICC